MATVLVTSARVGKDQFKRPSIVVTRNLDDSGIISLVHTFTTRAEMVTIAQDLLTEAGKSDNVFKDEK